MDGVPKTIQTRVIRMATNRVKGRPYFSFTQSLVVLIFLGKLFTMHLKLILSRLVMMTNK